ncbi:MAG: HSP90 family protein [Marinilabiliaceae bacterium]|nr:HSP90 family protein [Marinilabiliaceae bacterium]
MSQSFQVNLKGILKILSNHLYSSQDVFVRELLQNAVDAIQARKAIETNDFVGNITVELIQNEANTTLIFEDNGIGLTEEEVNEFLSKIGSSSKSGELKLEREEYIGQFGIGLLSCFMVSDTIHVFTRSQKSEQTIKWVGNIDGTYQVEKLAAKADVGTKIFMSLNHASDDDEILGREDIIYLLEKYGELLDVEVHLNEAGVTRQIGSRRAIWEKASLVTKEDIAVYGNEKFDMEFIDCFPVLSSDNKTKAFVYILPQALKASFQNSNLVYVKNMFISDACPDLLPDWAFFVKVIVNSSALTPTASRESLYKDEVFNLVKEEFSVAIKNYLVDLSKRNPTLLNTIIGIHNNSIKSLALLDDAFFQLIIPWIMLPTSNGDMKIDDILQQNDRISYVPDLDQFRQLSPIARANDQLVINAGFVYDTSLIKKLEGLHTDKLFEELDSRSFTNIFSDIDFVEHNQYFDFIERVNHILGEFNSTVELKKFEPANIPALFYMTQESSFTREIDRTREEVDNLWSGVMDDVFSETKDVTKSKFCLNLDNPIVKKLSGIQDASVLKTYVQLIYVNSLLMGHYPMNAFELDILNKGLIDIISKTIN